MNSESALIDSYDNHWYNFMNVNVIIITKYGKTITVNGGSIFVELAGDLINQKNLRHPKIFFPNNGSSFIMMQQTN